MATFRPDNHQIYLTGLGASERVVREVCRSVELSAKIQLHGGLYTQHRLGPSVHSDIRIVGSTVLGQTGSSLPYAKVVHNGAKRHWIRVNRAPGKPLTFYWRKVGRVVSFPYVDHPGMEGKLYLTDPLRVAARRHGMRVVIYPV